MVHTRTIRGRLVPSASFNTSRPGRSNRLDKRWEQGEDVHRFFNGHIGTRKNSGEQVSLAVWRAIQCILYAQKRITDSACAYAEGKFQKYWTTRANFITCFDMSESGNTQDLFSGCKSFESWLVFFNCPEITWFPSVPLNECQNHRPSSAEH